VTSERPRNRDAVDARQHQIENDQIKELFAGEGHRLFSAGDGNAFVSLESQMQAHQVADIRLIFNDENSGWHQFN